MEHEIMNSMLLPIMFGFALTVFGGLVAWGLTIVSRLFKNMIKP